VKRLVLMTIALLLSPLATADVVLLKNGDKLSGTVDSVAGGNVLLITEYAGAVAIAVDAVAEVTTEGTFDVSVGETTVNGQFAVVDGAQAVVSDGRSQALALADVSRAGQNNLGVISFTREWTSRADLAAQVTNGNTDTQNYSVLGESSLKQNNVEHFLSLLVLNEESEDFTTKEQLDLDYLYKRFVSEKWYASGNFEYFEDPIKDVDSRITLGAGMGYQFWDDSFGAFSSDLGVSYVKEDIGGESETNPALRWGLDYNRFFFDKRMEAFHRQSVLFIPDSDRGEVLESSTGVRYALNTRIDATARVDVNHETDPAPGNSKTDVTYNLGVGIKF
jgi:putative salt-induced outer membrane protein YdiY